MGTPGAPRLQRAGVMKRFLLPSAWWRAAPGEAPSRWTLDRVIRQTSTGCPDAATEWLRRIENGDPTANMRLAEFVQLAAREEISGQETLFLLFSDRAVTWARTRVGRVEDACDVAQNAFVIAFAALPALKRTTAFPAWLRTIVAREAVNHLRRHLRLRRVEPMSTEVDPPDRAEERPLLVVERSELLEHAWHALRRLPRKKRAAAALLLADMSYQEIADALEVPIGSVSSMISRLRTELGAVLDGRTIIAERSRRARGGRA